MPCLKVSTWDPEAEDWEKVCLYQDSMIQQNKYTENSILLPIFSSETKLLAILELSDSQNNFEDIDEQYFIRLVAEF